VTKERKTLIVHQRLDCSEPQFFSGTVTFSLGMDTYFLIGAGAIKASYFESEAKKRCQRLSWFVRRRGPFDI
jgi:hypothetical protein